MSGWSHHLRTPTERLAWARLSVFASPFDTYLRRRQVCTDELLPEAEVAGLLRSLVDKSLLAWVPTWAGERYRMLDTIREYGALRLRGPGEEEAQRRRTRVAQLASWRRGLDGIRAAVKAGPAGLWRAAGRRGGTCSAGLRAP
ncbi:hypothetical protein [Streptomyces sp. CA-132043]|uniref:hypothetical protein n=1 Tax=Streptomyces sp. CA-132043 TaxID=3240048 RepID=UPI003D93A365